MADIPASALLGQFAEEITPAGQAVLGLKAQPFTDNHGAGLGDIYDACFAPWVSTSPYVYKCSKI